MTSNARFHADRTNLRVRMMQVTTGESSEVLCRWLTRDRDPWGKWIGKCGLSRAWCDVTRRIAHKGMFAILLQ
jgi:hypothetical protein